MTGLPQASDGFDPAEGLLDPLANALADRVAGMAGGAAIDGRPPARKVLSHVRRDADRSQVRTRREITASWRLLVW